MLYVLSMTLMFFFLEDMYWFFANPFHSIIEKNEWHMYLGPIPLLYIVLPISAFAIAGLASIRGPVQYWKTFLHSFFIFFVGTIIVFIFSFAYKAYYKATHAAYVDKVLKEKELEKEKEKEKELEKEKEKDDDKGTNKE